jgi:thiamine-phosphate pyrophosphorylase
MISRLHYITQDVPDFTHSQLAAQAIGGGVDWVQLRVKQRNNSEWLQIAKETLLVCRQYNVKLIINDNVEIAKAIDADGVHLGKEDMSPSEARKILGKNKIIGGTANSEQDVAKLLQTDIDYIGLGPFRFTNTKEKLSPVLGPERIYNIIKEVNGRCPVIVIGGVVAEDVLEIMDSGAHGVAVSSAINFAADKNKAVQAFLANLDPLKITQ